MSKIFPVGNITNDIFNDISIYNLENSIIGQYAAKNIFGSNNLIIGKNAGKIAFNLNKSILIGNKSGTDIPAGINNILIGEDNIQSSINNTINLGFNSITDNNSITIGFNLDNSSNIITGYENNKIEVNFLEEKSKRNFI